VIDELRGLVERWVEAERLQGVFALFVTPRNLHAHDRVVRMDFFHRAFVMGTVDVDVIANLEHRPPPFARYISTANG